MSEEKWDDAIAYRKAHGGRVRPMSAEERALEAIRVTRVVLERARGDVLALLYMAAHDVGPDDVEDIIAEILEYLEMTGEEETPHG